MPKPKEHFLQLIGMIHKQTNTKVTNCINQCSKTQLLNYTNKLLIDNNCIPFSVEEIIDELA